MNAQRHAAYSQALRDLESLSLRDGERAVLRDAAEGYLLTAGKDSWELAELGLAVSIVLDRAVASRRLTRTAADRLIGAIEAAGPDDPALLAA